MKPRICVSLLPKNFRETYSLIERAEKLKADFIELRLDHLEPKINLNELANLGNIPKIAAIMSPPRKGDFALSKLDQHKFLIKAAKSGFQYVDTALDSPYLKETIKKLKSLNCKSIVSFHDFNRPLPLIDLQKILKKEISTGAEVCKIVTTAKKIQDNLDLLNFISKKSSETNLVSFCMGKLGRVSRLLSPYYGSFFTFASLEQGYETAEGQISIHDMKQVYKLLE